MSDLPQWCPLCPTNTYHDPANCPIHQRRAADARTPSFTDDEIATIRQALHDRAIFQSCRMFPASPTSQAGHIWFSGKHADIEQRVLTTCLSSWGLPTSVIAWVLGDPSPAPCAECHGVHRVGRQQPPTLPPLWG